MTICKQSTVFVDYLISFCRQIEADSYKKIVVAKLKNKNAIIAVDYKTK